MSVRVNFPFSGGGWRESDGRAQDRAARFRKGRKPGDTIRGVFVRSGPPGHGWVEVDGHLLLARLDAEPTQGQVLLFVIERLEPEIMLRLLDGGGTTAPAPATLLANYIEARDRLDTLLHAQLWSTTPGIAPDGSLPEAIAPDVLFITAVPDGGASIPPEGGHASASATGVAQVNWLTLSPEQRLSCFAAFVGSNAEAAHRYLACQKARLALLPLLRQQGIVFMQHMPWLHPAAQGLDVALASGGGRMRTVFAGATLPDAGPCLAEALWLPPQLGYHVRDNMAGVATCVSAPANTPHAGQASGPKRYVASSATSALSRRNPYQQMNVLACCTAPILAMEGRVEAALLSHGGLPAGPTELVARILAGLAPVVAKR